MKSYFSGYKYTFYCWFYAAFWNTASLLSYFQGLTPPISNSRTFHHPQRRFVPIQPLPPIPPYPYPLATPDLLSVLLNLPFWMLCVKKSGSVWPFTFGFFHLTSCIWCWTLVNPNHVEEMAKEERRNAHSRGANSLTLTSYFPSRFNVQNLSVGNGGSLPRRSSWLPR